LSKHRHSTATVLLSCCSVVQETIIIVLHKHGRSIPSRTCKGHIQCNEEAARLLSLLRLHASAFLCSHTIRNVRHRLLSLSLSPGTRPLSKLLKINNAVIPHQTKLRRKLQYRRPPWEGHLVSYLLYNAATKVTRATLGAGHVFGIQLPPQEGPTGRPSWRH
jgi:hypothetical protein